MSDMVDKAGPELGSKVEEVRGSFPTDQALQEAVSQLSMAGFDRADFSLPIQPAEGGDLTPEQSAGDPTTSTDSKQLRTMGTSMAGAVGALAAAGLTVATGGVAAAAIGAAAAAGLGSGAIAHFAGRESEQAREQGRDDAASVGALMLSVRTATVARTARAVKVMRDCGARDVQSVERSDDVSSGLPG